MLFDKRMLIGDQHLMKISFLINESTHVFAYQFLLTPYYFFMLP